MEENILKLQTFLWEGTNKIGNTLKGELNATSSAIVQAKLETQGINLTKVKKKPKAIMTLKKEKVKPKDVIVLTRHLATMITAGIPLRLSIIHTRLI